MKFYKILIFVLPILTSSLLTGQELRKSFADKQFKLLKYYYAAEAYEDVLERSEDSLSLIPNITISYDKIGNVEKAVAWYKFMHREDHIDSIGLLRLGLLHRKLRNYDLSLAILIEHSNKYGRTDITEELITRHEEISKLKEDSEVFEVRELSINSSASEMAASYFKEGKVVVTSSRKSLLPIDRVYAWTGGHYYNLYMGESDSIGDISGLKPIKGDVKTKYHEAYLAYDKETDYIYFTRNNYLGSVDYDENKEIRTKIYRAKFVDSKFKDVEELPFNSDNYSCGHPSISPNGDELYFVSDMPGGYGGSDIYSVSINSKGEFGKPKNLGGKVNTSANEVSPSFHPLDNVFYFSSEGHFGLGGYDVFMAEISKSGSVSKVKNLGTPINSSFDDISFNYNNSSKLGYLSSNRNENIDNIFAFKQLRELPKKKMVEGYVYDIVSLDSLSNISIYLIDSEGSPLHNIVSDSNGYYSFEILDEYGSDLVLKTEASLGYEAFNTKLSCEDTLCNVNIGLVPITEEPEEDLTAVLNLNPIYFDFDGSNIREESKVDLDKVVNWMNENPNKNIEVRSHTDTRGILEYNDWLSNQRAKSTIEYIISKGIPNSRINGKGYGERKLKISSQEISKAKTIKEKEKLHQLNRRSEFIVEMQ